MKANHRKLIRSTRNNQNVETSEKLFSILSNNSPSKAFQYIRSIKKAGDVSVPYIHVGNKKYHSDRVIDGLYESILKLKTLDYDHLEASSHHHHLLQDYKDILYLCKEKVDLPPISLNDSTKILR